MLTYWLPEVFFEILKSPLVDLMEKAILTISPTYNKYWRTEIITFLQGNYPTDDKVYAKRMQARIRPYTMIKDNYTRRVFVCLCSSPFLETKVKK
jgi:hypothetical protein